ncbi:GNAT family N-acetyltransferase [Phreatobacter sp.]|uniref:GNAT family N-acetyltransferase n=1 Tax=Phreatobacter sp. TaxID=1966341 RepID=UPI003F71E286
MDLAAMDLVLVQALEERMFNAWPALQTIYMDGWLIRMAGGHTKRANAASAWVPSDLAPDDLIAAVRRLYAKAGIEPMVRITPLASPGVDAALEAAGWTFYDPTLVMAAPLGESVAIGGDAAAEVLLEDAPSDAWVRGAAIAYELADWQRDILGRIVASIRVDTAFATVSLDGEALGYGLAVAERSHVGLYDLAVTPAARGRGVGARMVTELLAWGVGHGARTGYLQVRETNTGAQALYRRLGFADVYRYWCRKPPKA